MNQIFNPFLPPNEYIPDGEPHIFGDRLYLFGSHDKEGGDTFCMLDYTVWSAHVNDLKNWRCEGVIYQAHQDALYSPERPYMYAPDVVQGNDGRFYLYYCLSGKFGVGGYHGPISVAVCDTPAGEYKYLGFVRNPDGSPMKTYVCFDPAVLNDNGKIRLYYGTQYPYEEEPDFRNNPERIQQECDMFGKTQEEILGTPESVMGASVCVLEDDMLTIAEPPKHIIPYAVKGTDFENHPFFEAPSMRKIGDKYYFIYSSQQNHELCYAVSDCPDRDFRFGGTIVSNGDIGYQGRKPEDRLNMTGTTHGSIICVNQQWYVFYHRLTHKSDYSRQACAEQIHILPDGSIPQVEITSCGLNGAPLEASGTYPAVIACNITNGHMPHGSNSQYQQSFPNVTHENQDRFIAEIADGTLLGYKYFQFNKNQINLKLRIRYKSTGYGIFRIYTDWNHTQTIGEIGISPCENWTDAETLLPAQDGIRPLYLQYAGTGQAKLIEFAFISESVNPDADKTQKSSFFMALCLVAGAGIFLAGASLIGRIMNEPKETPPALLEETATSASETQAETIYFPPSATETESYRNTKKTTVTATGYNSGRRPYEAGDYEIGKDIPAGLYVAVADTPDDYGDFYFGIYAKRHTDSTPTIGGGWQQHYYYTELQDGQFIHFSWAKLYPFSESSQVLDPYASSGMFKAYHDIPGGTYTLIADSDYSGEYAVYQDITAGAEPVMHSHLEVGETAEVTIGEEQYLQTKFCHVIEESYPAGNYTVGKDIPSGLYVAVFEPNTSWSNDFLLEVRDTSGNAAIGGYAHQYRYADLKDGETLYFENATLYKAEYTRHVSSPFYTDGMFWVGHDVPAGTYQVHGGYSEKESVLIVHDSAGTDSQILEAKKIASSGEIITLHDGEFVELRECYLEQPVENT